VAQEKRLQKILARAGYGSRRACENLIREGRVEVNGQRARIGQKADPRQDRISVDGQPLKRRRPLVTVVLNKPKGVLSDRGDGRSDRPKARDLVPLPGRLFPVGRLDLWSEGLLLFTNDGELALRLTHPRYQHEKEYHVQVEPHPTPEALERWRKGVFLDGRQSKPAQVSILRRESKRTWLRIVLREGRKRQIRRVAAMLGHRVHRLKRVGLGPVKLGQLKPGEWRYVEQEELDALQQLKAEDRAGAGGKRTEKRG
jgi:23S rRNA pseudouridine2605 synthase